MRISSTTTNDAAAHWIRPSTAAGHASERAQTKLAEAVAQTREALTDIVTDPDASDSLRAEARSQLDALDRRVELAVRQYASRTSDADSIYFDLTRDLRADVAALRDELRSSRDGTSDAGVIEAGLTRDDVVRMVVADALDGASRAGASRAGEPADAPQQIATDRDLPQAQLAERTADAGETDTGDPTIDELLSNPSELLRFYEAKPEKFLEMWRGMAPEDRTLAMTRLQSEMQLTQQLSAMISNLMRSMHSANMSIARNLSI